MDFKLHAPFQPTGDQPEAIKQLLEGFEREERAQVLLGVTGSGKTFTVANVVAHINKPVLVLSHNKTLAAQLFSEFKQFFPENSVEYFVSYYDYYQPEAFLPASNTYIEKDLSINDEIEKLRLRATSALLSGRRDVIVVSSVSCIYGMGDPGEFHYNTTEVKIGQKITQRDFMMSLVNALYSRNDLEFTRGKFRVKGDTVDVFVAYGDFAYRLIFFDNEIESIESIDPVTGLRIEFLNEIRIFPANVFVSSPARTQEAIAKIQLDLGKQIDFFKEQGRALEAKRIEDRVVYDVEMIKEIGYCKGIENYSRYLDGREEGSRPFCLLDYFPDDFLVVIDESHATVPQIQAMYGGDRSRKTNLVEYGFRLPAALDNRPLKFDEFQTLVKQCLYVSATPADFELNQAQGVVVEQVIRPTGLLDPPIEIRKTENQIDDLLDEIERITAKNERTLVTTLTKNMAEELSRYMINTGIRCRYIHSDVDTLERVEILQDLRAGSIDVLIGVNLLREGLDLPEVSLVAILDADKEGFLRSARALTQTAGRAARNVNSKVIMYADKISPAMAKTIEETERRREKQMAYNEKHHITPSPIIKGLDNSLAKVRGVEARYDENYLSNSVAELELKYSTKESIQKRINELNKAIEKASSALDFLEADRLLTEQLVLQAKLVKNK